jgi:arylsulfatase A-like enzyme
MAISARPNIILVLVDDMGFADLGLMGSEIRTPSIDKLAKGGLLFTSMYNCARCCPTRAALLTGLYPHNAGIGHMGANLGTPAYQGYLRNDAATIAELMRHRTLMSGKWHVGGDFWARLVDTWRVGDVDRPTPRQRGFDRFYGIMDGVTHFFSPHYIMDDDKRADVSPTDYYFTEAITDKAIGMIEESVGMEKSFFLYLAHAAPHWPLHAHEKDIAKYDGVYHKGWDKIRTARHEEMLARGVLQHKWAISPRDEAAQSWTDVKQQDWEASRMAVYAAMIDCMDQSIGKVMAALRRLNIDDNTLVLFLSDNGGCAEFMAEDGWAKFMPDIHNNGRKIEMGNRPSLRPGGPLTYMSYDLPWANVSNAPFRLFKHWVHEGGISTPMIAHWPKHITAPRTIHTPCHVIDLLPTILQAAGVSYPSEFGGSPIQALDGESLMPLIEGKNFQREKHLYWEHEGNSAIRVGNFKLVRKHNQPWELYDMEADRTEIHDLAEKNASLVGKLTHEYEGWAEKAGVLDWNKTLPTLLKIWQMDDAHG